MKQERMTAQDFRASTAEASGKLSKYRNAKTEINGIRFDSKAEARYFTHLKDRESKGEVHSVQLQRPYALTINGYLVSTYKADFTFWDDAEKRERVIDVKGVITPEFRIKSKMMKAIYGIDVELAK